MQSYRIDQAPTLQWTVLKLRPESDARWWLEVWEQIGSATELNAAIEIADRDQEASSPS